MKWIVGLGNPGRRYESTAHNLGFDVVDELARRWKLDFHEVERAKALVADGTIGGARVNLVKPQTFMNLSGESIGALTRQRNIDAEKDLLAVTDDVTLPIGRLRIRPGGSAGGHNGLKSLIERLGHDGFGRLRVGIKPMWPVEDLAEYVLRKLPPLERAQLEEMAGLAADAVECWLKDGLKIATERYNGQRRFAAPPDGK